jgi:hypothetical protein
VDLSEALAFLAPAVRAAALEVEKRLSELGVRHAFVGAIAVGAHGHVRETADVDFLVGEEAFERHGDLVTFKPGVPIQVRGVRIDYLSPANLGPGVEACLDNPVLSDGLPVVPIEVLVYAKLVARRMQDQADVVGLVKKGADVPPIRAWLNEHAPDLVVLFDRLVQQAEEERS